MKVDRHGQQRWDPILLLSGAVWVAQDPRAAHRELAQVHSVSWELQLKKKHLMLK